MLSVLVSARGRTRTVTRGPLELECLESRDLPSGTTFSLIGANLYAVTNSTSHLIDTGVSSYQHSTVNGAVVDLHTNGTLNETLNNGTSWTTVDRLVSTYTLNAAGTSISYSDWFSTHLQNATLQMLARADYLRDGSITRGDMLGLFAAAEAGNTIASTAFHDLQTIVAAPTTLNTPGYVEYLATQVVNGDPANAHYQGIAVGNLAAGVPTWKLQDLVNKWFEGSDLPTESAAETQMAYRAVNLPLFGTGGPNYTEVAQGDLGDCTVLASIAEVSARDNNAIANMFIANGDGTWTVRFFEAGTPVYVTVNNQLPGGGNLYDHPKGDLWVALVEKAYAQLNEEGWLGTIKPGVNSYGALDGGNTTTMRTALMALSGQSGSTIAINPTNIAAMLQAGYLVVLGTNNTTTTAELVHNHAYAVVGYIPSSTTPFMLYNPWGISAQTNYGVWGVVTVNGSFLTANFFGGGYATTAPHAAPLSAVVSAADTGVSGTSDPAAHPDAPPAVVLDPWAAPVFSPQVPTPAAATAWQLAGSTVLSDLLFGADTEP